MLQVAPPATEVIVEVDLRVEDIKFANELATVLLNHVNTLLDALPGCAQTRLFKQLLISTLNTLCVPQHGDYTEGMHYVA